MHFLSYIKIIRSNNAAMASGAVLLGAWISRADIGIMQRILLAITAFFSTGFGNIVNDIIDIDSDRINHPDRPLPMGRISRTSAVIFSILCAGIALICSFFVAPLYGYATLLPLVLLVVYALYLKATPLAGNFLVSMLVTYSLLFGSLEAKNRAILYLPGLLAMLLNFSREIIKDLQDYQGDRAVDIITTASLPLLFLRRTLILCSIFYAIILFIPFITGICGKGYLITVLILVVPLHLIRICYFVKNTWTARTKLLSLLIKLEMLSGLMALTIDRLGS